MAAEELDPVADALDALAAGRPVVVAGRRTPGGEGHLVVPAEAVSAATVTFMGRVAGGLVCVSLGAERWDELGMRAMVAGRHPEYGGSVGVSIEAREGVTTGISAEDRARTIHVCADPASGPGDLVRPGHVFPLRAEPGGALVRAGRTEAAIDLCRLAGRRPVAAVCEILDERGAVADYAELTAFCAQHGLPLVEVADLVAHRWRHERLVTLVDERPFETSHARFDARAYRDAVTGGVHVALVHGDVAGASGVPVHVRRESLLDDVFGGAGAEAIDAALAALAASQASVLIYLTAPHHGLLTDVDQAGTEPLRLGGAPAMAPLRLAAQILRDLAPRSVRLTPADGDAATQLEALGVAVEHVATTQP